MFFSARLGGALACAVALGGLPAAPALAAYPSAPAPLTGQAAAPVALAQPGGEGEAVRFTELPDQFVAGAAPGTVTVEVSKARGECGRVRWSMVVRADGLRSGQISVDRIEPDRGSFGVDIQAEADGARITDEQLDPGELCRDETVEATYRFGLPGDAGEGQLSLSIEARDPDGRLLASQDVTRPVAAAGGRAERPDPTEEADEPAEDAEADPTVDEPAEPTEDPAVARQAAGDGDDQGGGGVPLAWFLIGALMVFLGLSLLLNVRRRQQARDADDGLEPAFAPVPRRPGRMPTRGPARYPMQPMRPMRPAARRWGPDEI